MSETFDIIEKLEEARQVNKMLEAKLDAIYNLLVKYSMEEYIPTSELKELILKENIDMVVIDYE